MGRDRDFHSHCRPGRAMSRRVLEKVATERNDRPARLGHLDQSPRSLRHGRAPRSGPLGLGFLRQLRELEGAWPPLQGPTHADLRGRATAKRPSTWHSSPGCTSPRPPGPPLRLRGPQRARESALAAPIARGRALGRRICCPAGHRPIRRSNAGARRTFGRPTDCNTPPRPRPARRAPTENRPTCRVLHRNPTNPHHRLPSSPSRSPPAPPRYAGRQHRGRLLQLHQKRPRDDPPVRRAPGGAQRQVL